MNGSLRLPANQLKNDYGYQGQVKVCKDCFTLGHLQPVRIPVEAAVKNQEGSQGRMNSIDRFSSLQLDRTSGEVKISEQRKELKRNSLKKLEQIEAQLRNIQQMTAEEEELFRGTIKKKIQRTKKKNEETISNVMFLYFLCFFSFLFLFASSLFFFFSPLSFELFLRFPFAFFLLFVFFTFSFFTASVFFLFLIFF